MGDLVDASASCETDAASAVCQKLILAVVRTVSARAISGRSDGMTHIPDRSAGTVSSIPPTITRKLRSVPRLSPADTVEALLYGGETTID